MVKALNKRSMQEYADREKCTDAEERRLEGIFRWKTAEGSLGAGKLKAEMQNRCCCVGFHVPRVKGQEIDGNNRCFFRIMKVVPRE